MGEVVSLFRAPQCWTGTIHVWMHSSDLFEIAHESRSGDSWGWFKQYDNAVEAVAAAHALNMRELNGDCEIYIPADVQALLPGGAA